MELHFQVITHWCFLHLQDKKKSNPYLQMSSQIWPPNKTQHSDDLWDPSGLRCSPHVFVPLHQLFPNYFFFRSQKIKEMQVRIQVHSEKRMLKHNSIRNSMSTVSTCNKFEILTYFLLSHVKNQPRFDVGFLRMYFQHVNIKILFGSS